MVQENHEEFELHGTHQHLIYAADISLFAENKYHEEKHRSSVTG
jgi:hypothetical protein